MPKKNDIVRLTIERCGLAGEGISHLDGQVVFVSGGLPGEVCKVQLLKMGLQIRQEGFVFRVGI